MKLSDDANEWIDSAERDRDTVTILLSAQRIPFEIVAFHCQQCAEKYLKAILVQHGVTPPFVHDLLTLSRRARADCPTLQDTERQCESLTPFGTATRYPGGSMRPASEHMPHVTQWMNDIRKAVRRCLGLSSESSGGDEDSG